MWFDIVTLVKKTIKFTKTRLTWIVLLKLSEMADWIFFLCATGALLFVYDSKIFSIRTDINSLRRKKKCNEYNTTWNFYIDF